MIRTLRFASVGVFFILACITQRISSQDLGAKIDAYMKSYVATKDFSGCIRIAQSDSTLYEGCFGYADIERQIPNTSGTKFKIGSISKQFTAAAILRLEEMGKLSILDTLTHYFPGYNTAQNITLEQLLTHTSGVQDIYAVSGFSTLSSKNIGIGELAKKLLETELAFDPGTRYQYSNGGYALLGALIEKVSDMDYAAFLKKELFDPLEMWNSGHEKMNDPVPDLAIGYEPLFFDSLKETTYIDPNLLIGSGSLYSTAHDLLKWIESIKSRSLLSKDSYGKFLKDYGNNYGLGISIYRSFDNTVFGHDGRINGFIADYLHYQESDVSIIISGNIQTGVADFLRRDLAAIVFGKEYMSRVKTGAPESNPSLKNVNISGTYAFGPNFKVYVEYKDGSFQARANEGGYSELVLLEDGRYFSRTLYSYISFVRDDSNQIIKMIWINNNGNQFEGTKI